MRERSSTAERTAALLCALLVGGTAAIGQQGQTAIRARDVALLLSGQEGGSLPLEAGAELDATRTGGGIRLVVELPVAPLLEAAGTAPLPVTVTVYAVSEDARVVATANEGVAIEPQRLAASPAAGVRLVTKLEMPSEPVDLRVLVRTAADGRFGLRSVGFVPPPVTGGADGADAASWIGVTPLAESSPWLEPGGAPTPESPSALPTVAAGDRLPVALWSVGAPASPPRLELVALAAAGRGETTAPGRRLEVVELVSRGEGEAPWRRARGLVRIPEVATGRYALRLAGGVTTPELLITPDSAAARSWAELGTRESRGDRASTAGTEKVRAGPTSRGLRQAIATFAATGGGDPGPLASVYRETWRRAGTEGLAVLVEELGRLAVRLRGEDPAALLPLVAAHGRLYRSFVEERFWAVSSATRRATVILLDLFSTASDRGTEEWVTERRSAAALGWIHLGDEVLQANLLAHAVAFYERGLELSSAQPHALAMLGAIYERVGEYKKAESAYRRLVATTAAAEGRLRLAIQRRRLGRRAAARTELSELLAADAPSWIEVVAAQELADLELEAGRSRAAAEILDRALAEHPDEESLVFHRAAVSELAGDHDEAMTILGRLGDPEPGRASPRRRYGLWPPARTGRLEEPFAADAASAHGNLTAAVEGLGWP